MEWAAEAEAAVKKVPFFVRKRVRARVEKEAQEAGKTRVTLADVKATQARYLSNMSEEIRGYQLEICFGPSGCPNRATISDTLFQKIEALFAKEDLLSFLRQKVNGELKFHHEFRVTLADCPNACSQPQIKDIGIIGAAAPVVTDETCSQCEACVDECKERAITLDSRNEGPRLDFNLCLKCGKCVQVCPTGTLATDCRGFRVQLGGKLGRHPMLAKELPGIYSEKEVLGIVKECISVYKKKCTHGQRFAEIFTGDDFEELKNRFQGKFIK